MDGWALIATFRADQFAAGRITSQHVGMAVRIFVADEILEDGLDVFYEVVGGPTEARQTLVADLKAQHAADIKVTQDRPDVFRFMACFKNLEMLKQHPVMKLELEQRYDTDRLWIVYEDGVCIMRNEFPPSTPMDVMEARKSRMAAICEEAGIDAHIRLGTLDRQLEDWRPFGMS